MISLALGEMKLDPAVFWRMSLREWMLAQRGFFQAKQTDIKREWEIGRMVAFYAYKSNPNLRRGSLRRFSDIAAFPWDGQSVKDTYTKEQIDYLLRKAGRFYDAATNTFHN